MPWISKKRLDEMRQEMEKEMYLRMEQGRQHERNGLLEYRLYRCEQELGLETPAVLTGYNMAQGSYAGSGNAIKSAKRSKRRG